MASSADFACSGGCGSISVTGSPALLSTIVQNGTSIQLQGMSNILLAPSKTYLVEYNAQFSTPNVNYVASSQLTLNGLLVPGSQTLSFPSTIPVGLNTPVSSVSGGVVLNTPALPNPSILRLIGFSPAGQLGTNFSTVNIRIVEIESNSDESVTSNNAAIYGYGYVDVAGGAAVPFLEAEVVNGAGIVFSDATPTIVSLAPNKTYFVSYNFIECPLIANFPVLVQLTLNDQPIDSSLSVAPPIEDPNSRSGGAGSAVFNTGPGPLNELKLINQTIQSIKFVAGNISIVQIG
ncbi:hypothetical protein I6N90_17515 [Paenibacillus sp. GSMTC-2017]|uniref:hypothetical protein n=1 Tax=Paenibacillus sp. GSMTC-2017 TaxID=2794350 RepID=UPI0018D633C1|nr:hypothetical protein [Paenibacillus sp. GSMTC-2017]MBH5319598.1 hypothetical protein [Paenibacillus sp. GSMTC-2017]